MIPTYEEYRDRVLGLQNRYPGKMCLSESQKREQTRRRYENNVWLTAFESRYPIESSLYRDRMKHEKTDT